MADTELMAGTASSPLSKFQKRDNTSNVEDLYVDALTLFTVLVDSSWRVNHRVNEIFGDELGRLFLWGEGFRDGKLDLILESYPDLRSSIVRFLIALSKSLIKSKSEMRIKGSTYSLTVEPGRNF